MTKKICLDAGHYGKYNPSPVVAGYYESDMNWKLHLLLKAELEKYGFEVGTTRADKDTDLGLVERGRLGDGYDLLLSLHSNAVGSGANEEVDYPVVYIPLNGSGTEIGWKLAKCIASVMGTRQEGRAETRKGSGNWDYYSVIYGAVSVGVPGLILEHSFHTNTRSTRWLMEDSNLKALAEAEAKILADHFGMKKPEDKPADEPEHWYRVRKSWEDASSQVGAYKVLENAKANCPEGYSVYDWNGNCIFYNGGGEFVTDTYPLEEFVRDIQKACGAGVDGIAGPETLSKTVTLSAHINATHPAVKPVQERLFYLGYQEVGDADGIAGPKFTSAVAHFQQDNGCEVDGEITARCLTWQKLLGLA